MADRQHSLLVPLSLAVMLTGWMSPEYAEKFGVLSLTDFLGDAPLAAALLSQSFWVVLAFVPRQQGGEWSLSLPCLGSVWFMASLVTVLNLVVHTMWYKSMTGTTPAINTLLWNLDILAALCLEAIVTLQAPTLAATLGGCITLGGTILALQSTDGENTWWGCLLCFTATTLFSGLAIFTSRFLDLEKCQLVPLMAIEGVLSLGACIVFAALSALEVVSLPMAPSKASVFMGMSALMLNLGWLSVAALLGAPMAAMAACLSLPLSLLLDAVLLHASATMVQLLGSLLVILGFCVSHFRRKEAEASEEREEVTEVTSPIC